LPEWDVKIVDNVIDENRKAASITFFLHLKKLTRKASSQQERNS